MKPNLIIQFHLMFFTLIRCARYQLKSSDSQRLFPLLSQPKWNRQHDDSISMQTASSMIQLNPLYVKEDISIDKFILDIRREILDNSDTYVDLAGFMFENSGSSTLNVMSELFRVDPKNGKLFTNHRLDREWFCRSQHDAFDDFDEEEENYDDNFFKQHQKLNGERNTSPMNIELKGICDCATTPKEECVLVAELVAKSKKRITNNLLNRRQRRLKSNNNLMESSLFITLNIIIDDLNDNPPLFLHNQLEYDELFGRKEKVSQILLSESVPVNFKYLIDTAKDLDSKQNGIATYALYEIDERKVQMNVNVTNEHHLKISEAFALDFDIDDDQLWLKVVKPLDREKRNFYRLLLIAYDKGEKPLKSYIQLWMNITDVNDNIPIFDKKSYTFIVQENINNGQLVGAVHAIDKDEGDNAKVLYSWARHQYQSAEKYFRIDKNTGEIFVANQIDYENRPNGFALTVQATDVAQSKQTSMDSHTSVSMATFVTVYIRILDMNDNDPNIRIIFTTNQQISEKVESEMVLARVIVSDKDTSQNGNISCYLWWDDEKMKDKKLPFSLMEFPDKSYAIMTNELASKIDREKMDIYQLVLKATDNGIPKARSAYYSFNISIIDENDNKPRFTSSEYVMNIEENSFRLLSPSSSNNHRNNDIIIGAIDDDIGRNAELDIEVVTTKPIGFKHHIALEKIQSNMIHITKWKIKIMKKFDREGIIRANTHDGIRCYTDIDEFKNVEIKYQKKMKNFCYISYLLKVTDNGNKHHFSSLSNLYIRVVDVNDNQPEIVAYKDLVKSQWEVVLSSQKSFNLKVKENVKKGETVAKLNVVDADSLGNGEISTITLIPSIVMKPQPYYIFPFYYDMNANEIRIKTTEQLEMENSLNQKYISSQFLLDYEKEKHYNFQLKLTDGGQPNLSNIYNISIDIVDLNEHKPELIEPINTTDSAQFIDLSKISIGDNSSLIQLMHLSARDKDEEMKEKDNYKLNNNLFFHLINIDVYEILKVGKKFSSSFKRKLTKNHLETFLKKIPIDKKRNNHNYEIDKEMISLSANGTINLITNQMNRSNWRNLKNSYLLMMEIRVYDSGNPPPKLFTDVLLRLIVYSKEEQQSIGTDLSLLMQIAKALPNPAEMRRRAALSKNLKLNKEYKWKENGDYMSTKELIQKKFILVITCGIIIFIICVLAIVLFFTCNRSKKRSGSLNIFNEKKKNVKENKKNLATLYKQNETTNFYKLKDSNSNSMNGIGEKIKNHLRPVTMKKLLISNITNMSEQANNISLTTSSSTNGSDAQDHSSTTSGGSAYLSEMEKKRNEKNNNNSMNATLNSNSDYALQSATPNFVDYTHFTTGNSEVGKPLATLSEFTQNDVRSQENTYNRNKLNSLNRKKTSSSSNNNNNNKGNLENVLVIQEEARQQKQHYPSTNGHQKCYDAVPQRHSEYIRHENEEFGGSNDCLLESNYRAPFKEEVDGVNAHSFNLRQHNKYQSMYDNSEQVCAEHCGSMKKHNICTQHGHCAHYTSTDNYQLPRSTSIEYWLRDNCNNSSGICPIQNCDYHQMQRMNKNENDTKFHPNFYQENKNQGNNLIHNNNNNKNIEIDSGFNGRRINLNGYGPIVPNYDNCDYRSNKSNEKNVSFGTKQTSYYNPDKLPITRFEPNISSNNNYMNNSFSTNIATNGTSNCEKYENPWIKRRHQQTDSDNEFEHRSSNESRTIFDDEYPDQSEEDFVDSSLSSKLQISHHNSSDTSNLSEEIIIRHPSSNKPNRLIQSSHKTRTNRKQHNLINRSPSSSPSLIAHRIPKINVNSPPTTNEDSDEMLEQPNDLLMTQTSKACYI
ncbi:hypothetical protein SNEBB_000168 [Seison nebaliae]|nr:hypothetical protein SNEBB_000168 [Seison nebaliae]